MKMYHLVIGFCWLSFFYFIGLANIAHTNTLEFRTKKNLTFMMPQGWAFFTKDPREVRMDAYKITESGEIKLLTIGNTSWENAIGLSKGNRYADYELSKIIPHIPKEAWKNGIGILGENIVSDSLTIIYTLEEELKNYYAGEEYLLYQYKPIPYAWAGKGQENHRPYLVARIKIAHKTEPTFKP